jgi:hypothetical protein
MKHLLLSLALLALCTGSLFSQSDATSDTKLNQSSSRKVSGNENQYSSFSEEQKVPQNLLQSYYDAIDSKNAQLKMTLTAEIEKYLSKPEFQNQNIDVEISKGPLAPYSPDWYGSDVQITNSDIANFGGYRQIDLKQGEDGWMYLAVNRRNVSGLNGCLSVYSSSNGGAVWNNIANITSSTVYIGAFSMLVESRNNSVPDSTRILVYLTASTSSILNSAYLLCSSFRRNGTAFYSSGVAIPSSGNRFVNPTACSDGTFWENNTFMHAVVREETNAGEFVKLHHFRSTDWGLNHTVGSITTAFDEKYPVSAFSNEVGSDSIYIAVERVIDNNEHEIRLFAVMEVPTNNWTLRYITDAPSGTIYERPAITIQQRIFTLPQRILVTCTKNDKAVYHFSTDGGALWNIDFGLGLNSQAVDYTSCNSDTLYEGGKDFVASFVDLNGDSVTVRHGQLGFLGNPQYKINSFASTGTLAPACAIYKEGNDKYSAFAYAGVGPNGVYYNMENFITGITPLSNETPVSYSLNQNYPNPFNPVTNIKFSIPKAGLVKLIVYDISGREVAALVNQNLNAGTFNYDFDASSLSSGIYFYRLTASDFSETKKMMLVK